MARWLQAARESFSRSVGGFWEGASHGPNAALKVEHHWEIVLGERRHNLKLKIIDMSFGTDLTLKAL